MKQTVWKCLQKPVNLSWHQLVLYVNTNHFSGLVTKLSDSSVSLWSQILLVEWLGVAPCVQIMWVPSGHYKQWTHLASYLLITGIFRPFTMSQLRAVCNLIKHQTPTSQHREATLSLNYSISPWLGGRRNITQLLMIWHNSLLFVCFSSKAAWEFVCKKRCNCG